MLWFGAVLPALLCRPPRRASAEEPWKSTRAFSMARLRLRGGHETGRLEPPSQPPAGDIVHPESGKLCLVSPGGPNVDDEQPPAWAQHPYRFADCSLPAGTHANVVDREVGENHIKALVLKGQRPQVTRVQFDPIRHSLGDGVALGGLGRIAGLIDLSPKIHSHGPARGQVLRSHQEHRTPAASQVQDALVAPKPQPIEQFGPDHELAPKCGVDEESFEGGDEKDSQPEPRPAGNDCQEEVKDDQAGKQGRSEGGVDSIRTTPPRDHAPGHTVTPAASAPRKPWSKPQSPVQRATIGPAS